MMFSSIQLWLTRTLATSILDAQNSSQSMLSQGRPGRIPRSVIAAVCFFGLLFSAYWSYARLQTYSIRPASEVSQSNKHLVVASYGSQDVSWMKDIPSEWSIKRYIMDHKGSDPPRDGLPVPKNFGREAMAYLTYIIDHYDNLPHFAVFIHGHNRAWHQQAPISAKVRALNLTALSQENYISFRCEDSMGCERRPFIDTETVTWEGERHMRKFWHHILPNAELARNISYKCCGQHAVTAKAIRTRSKADWIRIRSPLLREIDEMEKNEEWARDPVLHEYTIGAWFEKLWHVLLGAENEYCPSVEHCRQVHFRNAIVCSGDQELTVFSGELWKQNRCITAFDGVPADEEPNWAKWSNDFGFFVQGLDREKLNQWQEKEDRIHELEAEVAELKKGRKPPKF